jgi:Rrf2 family protein
VIYSRSTQYAIRAMAFLAGRAPGELVRARDIARATGVPLPFLLKITQALGKRGLLRSVRGPGGGIRLARAPRAIALEDIVVAVEGQDATEGCALGLPHCNEIDPCPVHDAWKTLRAEIRRVLHERTLEELARALEARQRPPRGGGRAKRRRPRARVPA